MPCTHDPATPTYQGDKQGYKGWKSLLSYKAHCWSSPGHGLVYEPQTYPYFLEGGERFESYSSQGKEPFFLLESMLEQNIHEF